VLTPAQADELIAQHLQCLPIESLPLAQCAGAVLRENIYAERDQPPFDRVAMDGIALDSTAVSEGARRLHIQATQAAGDPPLSLGTPTSCIEVMTGAMMPAGCDSVVPVEQIAILEGEAELAADVTVEPWQNVHRRGTDTRQGTLLVSNGVRLRAPEIAIAASAGMAPNPREQPADARGYLNRQRADRARRTDPPASGPAIKRVRHRRRPPATGLSTRGRRSHRRRCPGAQAKTQFHLETHDVLVLSGGVSMGKLDLVPKVLDELGVHTVFHKVAQRPGKPMWFGVASSGAAVFALPGNPVSSFVCLAGM